jgi:hypothetical protein
MHELVLSETKPLVFFQKNHSERTKEQSTANPASLYEALMEQGEQEGLEAGAVWTIHWQSLIDNICLLATSALPKDEDPIQQANAAIVATAAQTLSHFFADTSMHA